MGILRRVLRILWGLFLVSVLGYSIYNYETVEFSDNGSEIYLLTAESCDVYCEKESDNTAYTDLAAVSNMILNMQASGFTCEVLEESASCYDVVLTKGTEQYRVYYTKDRKLTVISNHYENSYVPFTYINERVLE